MADSKSIRPAIIRASLVHVVGDAVAYKSLKAALCAWSALDAERAEATESQLKKKHNRTAPAITLELSATALDRLHEAHDDLNRGICIVDCVIGSLAGKEVQFAEQEALRTASKLMWPASQWISDVRVEHDTGGDGEREL